MYIAFYRGKKRLFNRFVGWWTQGPYSHCEAVLDDPRGFDGPVLCWSSSFLDGGVRSKIMALDPANWDIINCPSIDTLYAADWFSKHKGAKYDVIGLLSTSLPVPDIENRYFCNEAVGAAAGLKESWRLNPNSFARLVELMPGSQWVYKNQ